MSSITMKGYNQQVIIYIHKIDDWNGVLKEFQQKLSFLKSDESNPIDVEVEYFYELTYQQKLDLNTTCINNHVFLSKCRLSEPYQSSIEVIEEPLRGGQVYQFDHDVLILKDIKQDVFLKFSKGNLYVVGEIMGSVEMMDSHSYIVASGIYGARIKMNGLDWQIVTKDHRCKLYTKQDEIHIFNEEEIYVKSYYDCQW